MYKKSFSRKGGWTTHNSTAYRSGLEENIAVQLEQAGIKVLFETHTIVYEVPASTHRYTPDFILPNGIIVESKGLFEVSDRKKHLLIKKQHPDLDIRFVFSNPSTKISKKSRTSYADWCTKHGFLFAKKFIPSEWILEKPRTTAPNSITKRTKGKTNVTATANQKKT